MKNIILAIKNEKIYEQLNKIKDINIISNNIQYKEGILEVLEKNKNVNYIIINEEINGQIKITELIKQIKKINNNINIIIILIKKDKTKEMYFENNNIKYIYSSELNVNEILKIIAVENNIISILGCSGAGKTIIMLLISKVLSTNKKVLIIEENNANNTIIKLFKKEKFEEKIINLKNNLYVLNINKLIKNTNINEKNQNKYLKENIKRIQEAIKKEINKIKNNYDYIFIEVQNLNKYKMYEEIINKNLIILNSNIIDLNKTKKYINYLINKNINVKIVLNNYNKNSISEKIIEEIFKNKISVIEKIENNNNFNLLINNEFKINYISKNIKNRLNKIIINI